MKTEALVSTSQRLHTLRTSHVETYVWIALTVRILLCCRRHVNLFLFPVCTVLATNIVTQLVTGYGVMLQTNTFWVDLPSVSPKTSASFFKIKKYIFWILLS